MEAAVSAEELTLAGVIFAVTEYNEPQIKRD